MFHGKIVINKGNSEITPKPIKHLHITYGHMEKNIMDLTLDMFLLATLTLNQHLYSVNHFVYSVFLLKKSVS